MMFVAFGALLVMAGFLIGRLAAPTPKIVLELHAMDRPNPRTQRQNGQLVTRLFDQDNEPA